jgi:hypothetical protein
VGDIVLAGLTSGACTLHPTDVSGSTVLTLPAVSGTVITTGTTGQVIPKAALPTGSVLQVVNATTTTATSTTSNTFVATLLTASITPISASNKILVQVTGPADSAVANSQVQATIYRNSTNIGVAGVLTNIFSNAGRLIGSIAMTLLDSPATTSTTSYTVYILGTAGATIIFPQGGGGCSITLMEIAA